MKKLVMVIMVVMMGLIFSLPQVSMGEDTKEVLTLKRDLTQERMARIQTQLALMQQQFKEGQDALTQLKKELDELNAKIKATEPKAEAKPEPKKESPKAPVVKEKK